MNSSNERVFVEKWFYDECKLQDWFYLVHKNKVGDKVFGTDYSLTKTVSVPSDKMTLGELTFELYAPNQLGTTPMRRTDKSPVRCNSFHINDVKLKYTTSEIYFGVLDKLHFLL